MPVLTLKNMQNKKQEPIRPNIQIYKYDQLEIIALTLKPVVLTTNTAVTPTIRNSLGICLKRRVSFPIRVDTCYGTCGALVRKFEVMLVTAKG